MTTFADLSPEAREYCRAAMTEYARLAREQEREACAAECDRIAQEFKQRLGMVSLSELSADACAAAIRARSA